MYRYLAYYGRQGAGMQMISAADIALWDIAGKALGQPVCKLLGAKYRDRVKAYASTLFRPTPDDMQRGGGRVPVPRLPGDQVRLGRVRLRP